MLFAQRGATHRIGQIRTLFVANTECKVVNQPECSSTLTRQRRGICERFAVLGTDCTDHFGELAGNVKLFLIRLTFERGGCMEPNIFVATQHIFVPKCKPCDSLIVAHFTPRLNVSLIKKMLLFLFFVKKLFGINCFLTHANDLGKRWRFWNFFVGYLFTNVNGHFVGKHTQLELSSFWMVTTTQKQSWWLDLIVAYTFFSTVDRCHTIHLAKLFTRFFFCFFLLLGACCTQLFLGFKVCDNGCKIASFE
mmetsp:Transcript_15590/g.23376  ORF Transcript_15590/g.23376 Transcript_15590/m.23376 type:complete len:250 (-) Transcript_15590:74-823(-)